MTLNEDLLFESFKEEADLNDPNWFSGVITLENAPTPTYGLKGSSDMKTADGSRSRAGSFFNKAKKHLEEYFRYASSNGIANEIELVLQDKKLVKITPRWNQGIIDTFESYLPKSKKGTFKPWYIDEEAWNKNHVKPKKKKKSLIDVKVSTIPSHEDAIGTTEFERLDLQAVATLVSPYCLEAENELWDVGSVYFKKAGVTVSAELIQFYFEDKEDKEQGFPSVEQRKALKVTDRMLSIYHALQGKTSQIDQSIKWDDVFITISRKGLEDLQLILDDEELDFDWGNR